MKRTITLIALVAALLIPSTASAQRMPAKSSMKLSQFKAPARALAEEEPIMDVPEGTLYDNMYATSFAYGLGWGDIYIQDVDGGIGKVVEGTDGNLYIYNPISPLPVLWGHLWFPAFYQGFRPQGPGTLFVWTYCPSGQTKELLHACSLQI